MPKEFAEWLRGELADLRLSLEREWAERAEEAYRLGFAYEQEYHGCGQCVLAAVHEATGLLNEAAYQGAFEAATGLAGGVGLCGDGTCSALTGGALALGLYSPRRRAHFDGDRESKYRAYDLIERLRERFVSTYGSAYCHDIHRHELGRAFDLRDPGEREAFEAAGAHQDKCTGVVARAARWTVEIIGEEKIRRAMGSKGCAGRARDDAVRCRGQGHQQLPGQAAAEMHSRHWAARVHGLGTG